MRFRSAEGTLKVPLGSLSKQRAMAIRLKRRKSLPELARNAKRPAAIFSAPGVNWFVGSFRRKETSSPGRTWLALSDPLSLLISIALISTNEFCFSGGVTTLDIVGSYVDSGLDSGRISGKTLQDIYTSEINRHVVNGPRERGWIGLLSNEPSRAVATVAVAFANPARRRWGACPDR